VVYVNANSLSSSSRNLWISFEMNSVLKQRTNQNIVLAFFVIVQGRVISDPSYRHCRCIALAELTLVTVFHAAHKSKAIIRRFFGWCNNSGDTEFMASA
jgi:hypothetical protein